MTQNNKNTVIIYKMAKKWKALLVFSLLINLFVIMGVVKFSNFGTDRIAMILSGNIYPINLLSHDGVNKWRKHERMQGYDLDQDVKNKETIILDLLVMLKNGGISPQLFKLKMTELHTINSNNFDRFVNDFPNYWNGLTPEKRTQYIKTIKQEDRYYD